VQQGADNPQPYFAVITFVKRWSNWQHEIHLLPAYEFLWPGNGEHYIVGASSCCSSLWPDRVNILAHISDNKGARRDTELLHYQTQRRGIRGKNAPRGMHREHSDLLWLVRAGNDKRRSAHAPVVIVAGPVRHVVTAPRTETPAPEPTKPWLCARDVCALWSHLATRHE
jgi:hypothetical protein